MWDTADHTPDPQCPELCTRMYARMNWLQEGCPLLHQEMMTKAKLLPSDLLCIVEVLQ